MGSYGSTAHLAALVNLHSHVRGSHIPAVPQPYTASGPSEVIANTDEPSEICVERPVIFP